MTKPKRKPAAGGMSYPFPEPRNVVRPRCEEDGCGARSRGVIFKGRYVCPEHDPGAVA